MAASAPVIAPAWTLTVGGVDISFRVLNGARFVENASSVDGLCTFTINGADAAVVSGASILLSTASGTLWEGTVTTATVQYTDGTATGTMVLGAPLAAQLNVGAHYVTSTPVDITDIGSALCAQTPIPFGSQTNLGSTGGTLSVQNVASGLTVAALIGRRDWRVENGSVVFVGPDTFTALAEPLTGTPTSGSSVVVVGGLDAATKQPLKGSFGINTERPSAPVLQASHSELADYYTLAAAGAAIAERYSDPASVTTTQLAPGTVVRAGDWFIDPNGVPAIGYTIAHELIAGLFTPTVTLGYPALPVAPAVPDSTAQRLAQHPPSRLANDFLVSGGALTTTGLQVTLSTAQIVLGGSPYSVSGATLTLDPGATALVTATSTGFAFADSLSLPQPGTAVPLYIVSTNAETVVGTEDVAPRGGIGTYHLKPATPAAPTATLNSLSLSAEGTTQALATISFTIGGVTLDDTIQSFDATWSIAGQNQWHPPIPCVWSPGSSSVTAYVHGLAAVQGYDIGVWIRGRNGATLNASPLLLGTSPTISASAIAIALDLDQVNDGTTYAKVKATELQGGSNGAGTVKQLNDGAGTIRTITALAGAINNSADAFGSYNKPGSIHGLILDVTGQPGAGNLVYNPTGAAGYSGWSRTQGATQVCNWTSDTYGGGRFLQNNPSASLATGQFDGWEQTISSIQNVEVALRAILDWGGSTVPAGVTLWVDVINSARNAVLGGVSLNPSGTRVPKATAFSTGANSTVYLRFYVYNTSGTTQTIPDLTIAKIQLEYGTQPSPWVDHLASAVHNQIFDGSANAVTRRAFGIRQCH